MKKIILLLTMLLIYVGVSAQGTINPTFNVVRLNDLKSIRDSLIAVQGSLVPKYDSAFNLGSDTNRWNVSYLDTVDANVINEIIYVNGTQESDIQDAIDAATMPAIIVLSRGVTYIQSEGIVMRDGLTIIGNGATLKRGAASVAQITVQVTSDSTYVVLDTVPLSWEVGNALQIFTDSTISTSTFGGNSMQIQSISGDTVFLVGNIGPEANTSTTHTWPVGSYVRKIYNQMASSLALDVSFHVSGLTFDGNKSENDQNYYWGINYTVVTQGGSTFESCIFRDIPNENIAACGASIINCQAYNLNGSFYHIGCTRGWGIENFMSQVTGNKTDSTNLIPYAVSGHNEAVITLSVGGGYFVASGNTFRNAAQSVIGWIHSGGTNEDDLGTKNLIFSNNVVYNDDSFTNISPYQQIVCCMAHGAGSDDTSRVSGISIQDNVFHNCGSNDWSSFASAIDSFDGLKMCNNVLSGGTTLINVPQSALCDSLQAALTYQRTAVLFASPTDGYIQDDSLRLNYDSTNRRLGIGVTATANLHLRSNSASSGNMVLFENSTPSAAYTITNTRQHTMASAQGSFILNTAGTGPVFDFDINSSGSITNFIRFGFGTISSATSGTITAVRSNGGFSASSGTAIFNNILLDFTINQTGSATGITRGIYMNPTVTAFDFRGIEINKGKIYLPFGSGSGSGGEPWIPTAAATDSLLNINASTGQVTKTAWSQGVYLPVDSAGSNVDGVTPDTAFYTRVGNVVTVSGVVEIDPTTTATPTFFYMNVPVFPANWNTNRAGGTFAAYIVNESGGIIMGGPTSVLFQFNPTATGANIFSYTYSYRIQ